MTNNNYKIIRTIYENVFQRVLECRDNTSNDLFYNNVITSDKVINLIDVENLKNISTNIIKCKKTEDRLYIITKPLMYEYRNIKDYIKTGKLTLKQQFSLTKKIINLSSDIYNMKDIVQKKILDLDKIFVDEKGDVVVDLNLIFEDEYDISDNETLKRMGNIIHYIFSGSEIVDYNISEAIPPDILKIIVRCLTREYMYPKNALSELKASPIYKMINPGGEEENNQETSGLNEISSAHGEDIDGILKDDLIELKVGNKEAEEDSNGEYKDIYELFLNDSNNEKSSKNKNKKVHIVNGDFKKLVISLIIVLLVLITGRYVMDKYNQKAKPSSSDNIISNNTDNNNNGESNLPVNENNTDDSTSKFFNDTLLAKVNYTGVKAEYDKNIYVEGNQSLLVNNENDEQIKSLFATVDFTDTNYSYLLKQQIGISAKIKSENDLSALILLEAYKDGKVASTFHIKINIYNDIWSQYTVPINVTNADSLNVYVEYSGKNKIWIDSVAIDAVK